MKKEDYVRGDQFHASSQKIYGGSYGWAVNKRNELMTKVVYEAVHENMRYQDDRRGHGLAYSTWVFSEERGLQEHLASTAFELMIDSTLEPHAAIGFHLHDRTEEYYYIIAGSIKMTTVAPDGKEHSETLRAGDGHMVKLGQAHFGKAGPEGCRFIAFAVRPC